MKRSGFGEAEGLLCLTSVYSALDLSSEEHPASAVHFGALHGKQTLP